MPYPLAALQIRPSTFDPVGVLQTAQQLQRGQQEGELTRLRMAEMQEQMRENRDRRGALGEFRAAGGVESPSALRHLSGHLPEYTQAQAAQSAHQQWAAQQNARAAQRVQSETDPARRVKLWCHAIDFLPHP